MVIPCVVIAGTHSGAGKTTISIAIMAALVRRGLRVQGFKVGPDFIDPSFHTHVTGRPSRNLDGWMLSRAANEAIFARGATGADIAVVEGVMGAFDGRDAAGESGSTVEMAKWLGAPLVLVVDASAMARSAAAVVHGFQTFDPDAGFAGVIFNRVGSVRHAGILREAVKARVLGVLPRDPKIALPERHLGLTMATEVLIPEIVDGLADWVEAGVDLDALVGLAKSSVARMRIGVARDAAFCFYYEDNLDLLLHAGAELVEFSPLRDANLPGDLDGLYLGGGYPELHASTLAANVSLLEDIRRFKGPVYAECGGFMYLTRGIVDFAGVEHKMAGIFPTIARMRKTRTRLGYVSVSPVPGMEMRGHEFRYSDIDEMPDTVASPYPGGYSVGRVLASYIHLHFASCPEFARAFYQ